MRQRTPQEKKKLSLEKDRRNVYGESPHGARKSIPRFKKLRNRINRHQQESNLPSSPTQLEEDEADKIESSIQRKAPKKWSKSPDAALGEVIANKQLRRVESHGRNIRSRAMMALDRGDFFGNCPTCGSDVYILVGRHAGERNGAFCAVGQGLPDPTFAKINIRPCRPGELPEAARELYCLCSGSNDLRLGNWVCRLFGTCTCSHCRKSFDVGNAVAASAVLKRVCSARGFSSLPHWLLGLSQWLYYQR
jgi:hypothetical protein